MKQKLVNREGARNKRELMILMWLESEKMVPAALKYACRVCSLYQVVFSLRDHGAPRYTSKSLSLSTATYSTSTAVD